jgi:hypothetical protein
VFLARWSFIQWHHSLSLKYSNNLRCRRRYSRRRHKDRLSTCLVSIYCHSSSSRGLPQGMAQLRRGHHRLRLRAYRRKLNTSKPQLQRFRLLHPSQGQLRRRRRGRIMVPHDKCRTVSKFYVTSNSVCFCFVMLPSVSTTTVVVQLLLIVPV